MGGFFAAASSSDCVEDLFYGTDYHSHLGTKRGGLAVLGEGGIDRSIHSIENALFRSKFEADINRLRGRAGIGVISDTDNQPVLVRSHLGTYAIVTVGVVRNAGELLEKSLHEQRVHFAEMNGPEPNMTELVAALINRSASFAEGIADMWNLIEGSCSLAILTAEGIYVARDRWGRTPVIIGFKPGACAATQETCAFPNLGYTETKDLGPGEVVLMTADGVETVKPPDEGMQICAFLWVYYGYPASSYEGINVEAARNRCGAMLARREHAEIDLVAGIPDSGVGHGLGYAAEAGLPFRRPFVKYTPTWARSFMPPEQEMRDLVARMKLIPIKEIIRGRKLLFCEDSIVRGTQLKDTIMRLYEYGALEVHMRPACPPLVFACPFLNFSRSKSEFDLAARKAIRELEPDGPADIFAYTRPQSPEYKAMVERIEKRLRLTSLRYQLIGDMVAAIGLPGEKLCTYCWQGRSAGKSAA